MILRSALVQLGIRPGDQAAGGVDLCPTLAQPLPMADQTDSYAALPWAGFRQHNQRP